MISNIYKYICYRLNVRLVEIIMAIWSLNFTNYDAYKSYPIFKFCISIYIQILILTLTKSGRDILLRIYRINTQKKLIHSLPPENTPVHNLTLSQPSELPSAIPFLTSDCLSSVFVRIHFNSVCYIETENILVTGDWETRKISFFKFNRLNKFEKFWDMDTDHLFGISVLKYVSDQRLLLVGDAVSAISVYRSANCLIVFCVSAMLRSSLFEER